MNYLRVLLGAFFSIQITHCNIILMVLKEQLAGLGIAETDTQR